MVSIQLKGKLLLATVALAAIFDVNEATGSDLLGNAIILLLFQKFLGFPVWFGKRSVVDDDDSDESAFVGRRSQTMANEYLARAASMDTDFCLPVAICSAMARARPLPVASARAVGLSRFDELVVKTFGSRLNGRNIYAFNDRRNAATPWNAYLAAAKFGQEVGVADACRQVSPACKLTVEELRLITVAIADYNI